MRRWVRWGHKGMDMVSSNARVGCGVYDTTIPCSQGQGGMDGWTARKHSRLKTFSLLYCFQQTREKGDILISCQAVADTFGDSNTIKSCFFFFQKEKLFLSLPLSLEF